MTRDAYDYLDLCNAIEATLRQQLGAGQYEFAITLANVDTGHGLSLSNMPDMRIAAQAFRVASDRLLKHGRGATFYVPRDDE